LKLGSPVHRKVSKGFQMRTTEEECAAMAAAMLDIELLTITRRLQGESHTDFQRAVIAEARRRKLESLPA